MIWAPRTWVPGELVTASNMNANIRDHLNAGRSRQTTTSTGTQNNFAVESPFTYLIANNATPLAITGLLVDGGNVDGARLMFDAIDAPVMLVYEDGGSIAANRILTPGGQSLILAAGERATLTYDGANLRWRAATSGPGDGQGTNLVPDPWHIVWPAGDAAPPAGWVLSGNGSVARETGAGNVQGAGMSVKLTLGATGDTYLYLDLATTVPPEMKGRPVALSVSVKTAVASLAQIAIDDGVGTTYSEFHSGGGTFERLGVAHVLDASATRIRIIYHVDTDVGAENDVAYFDLPVLLLGSVPAPRFRPSRGQEGKLFYPSTGSATTGTDKDRFQFSVPTIVRNVSLMAITQAPTGQALIVDVNHWDGAAWQSMFSTRPQIANGATQGGADPDGTYRYRCFAGGHDTDAADVLLDFDVDQIGSANPGGGLRVLVNALQWERPLWHQQGF